MTWNKLTLLGVKKPFLFIMTGMVTLCQFWNTAKKATIITNVKFDKEFTRTAKIYIKDLQANTSVLKYFRPFCSPRSQRRAVFLKRRTAQLPELMKS